MNPGLILEIYLAHLNPMCEYLFQHPQRPSKNFLLSDPKTTVLFETTKVGVNIVGAMLPNLCKILKFQTVYTNHCMRATGIMLLKEAGYNDREIIKLTGHKVEKSLNNYDPSNSVEKKSDMADVLMLGQKRKLAQDDNEANMPPVKKIIAVSTVTTGQHDDTTPNIDGFRGFETQPPREDYGYETCINVSQDEDLVLHKSTEPPPIAIKSVSSNSTEPSTKGSNFSMSHFLFRQQDIRASEIAQRKDDTDLMKSMHSLNGELA